MRSNFTAGDAVFHYSEEISVEAINPLFTFLIIRVSGTVTNDHFKRLTIDATTQTGYHNSIILAPMPGYFHFQRIENESNPVSTFSLGVARAHNSVVSTKIRDYFSGSRIIPGHQNAAEASAALTLLLPTP